MSIEVRHLNVWYGRAQALYDINLTIKSLAVTAIIGPSGCGKSTFVRCLNRMHEEIAGGRVEGEVLIDGVNIYARSIQPMYVRRHIGMVFQRPNPLPTRSIWENVAIGPRINGMASGSSLQGIVENSLKQAALWEEVKDRLNEPAIVLSGGQQQRLCIARALAMEPKILLMDEPCSALDPISTFQVEELIHELKTTYTIIIVTHNMQQAGRLADTTAFFLQGKLVEVSETTRFFSHPEKKETEEYITGRFS
ncbi:MAG TPA: phosphate ABC transporter ATP-binding protein PstB [Ktedonobacteraceae bacterium]|nr:phosphate ABC transporter ATP-binding protein PstB [Ktedonobacteraceae bacterium]